MAKCDTFNFNGITPDVFNEISSELAGKGFALSGPSGTVNGPFGIIINYIYDEAQQSLTIDVVEKSFFVTCNQIKNQLTSALNKYVN